jgi:hypothetical protein
MCNLRTSGSLRLTALLTAMLSLHAHAQSLLAQPSPISTFSATPSSTAITSANLSDVAAAEKLADSPSQHLAGSISGTVLDANGAEIAGAHVALDYTDYQADSKPERTVTTQGDGSFQFDGVEPGRFTLAITSTGFTSWVSPKLALNPGESHALPPVALEIAAAVTSIEVNFTRHDIAEDQMHFEENQRVLGVFPNFYVSYIKDPVPFSSGQKFRLALRTTVDPVSIAIPAVIAGVEQAQNNFSGYGQGMQGYAKRFGASSADSAISIMITDAILPSILHQDPRYFYKGTGSIRSRALYAIATVFICKGDNGRWQPNYSNVLGNLASASISNAYYPSSDSNRVRLTIDNWLIGTASGAVGTLFQEFLVKRLSHGIQPLPGS